MSDAEIGGASSPSAGNAQLDARPVAGPGAQLRTFREERGLTIEQVAGQLNLASRQIQALENDNYSALPGLVIAKGFVRAYAKLLKVDAAPLVAMVGEESVTPMDSLEMQRALAESLSESMLPEMKRKPAASGWAVGVILLIVVMLGALAAYQLGWLTMPSPAGSDLSEARPQSASEQMVAAAPQVDGAPAQSQTSPSVAATPVVPSAPIASAPAVEPISPGAGQAKPSAAVSAQPPSQAAAAANGTVADNVTPPTPSPSNVVLTVKQDSWIEIKRADDTVLISRIVKAGSTEAFDLSKPATMVIGNVAGVDVVVRGKPVELKPIAKTNVARMELK